MSSHKMSKNASEELSDQFKTIDTAFGKIINRNEERVKKILCNLFTENEWHQPDLLDLQDIYALTLNNLPARYTQEFSIVLKEPLTDDQIKKEIRKAALKVFNNPKRKV